jgi:hypothetical protein
MDEGGIRFISSEVLELSAVTIPANADATINQIRSIDAAELAATGKELTEEVDLKGAKLVPARRPQRWSMWRNSAPRPRQGRALRHPQDQAPGLTARRRREVPT